MCECIKTFFYILAHTIAPEFHRQALHWTVSEWRFFLVTAQTPPLFLFNASDWTAAFGILAVARLVLYSLLDFRVVARWCDIESSSSKSPIRTDRNLAVSSILPISNESTPNWFLSNSL